MYNFNCFHRLIKHIKFSINAKIIIVELLNQKDIDTKLNLKIHTESGQSQFAAIIHRKKQNEINRNHEIPTKLFPFVPH